MSNKYINRVMMGLILGILPQHVIAYDEISQENAEQQTPKGKEEATAHQETDYVPKNLDSAIITVPVYPMSDPVSKVITTVEKFLYSESQYKPAVILSRLPDGISDSSTPEKTMFSRTTAMINGDYDLYSSFWDKKSQAFTEQYFTMNGITPERMVGNWVGTLRQVDMVMLRRIDFAEYVVLVYDMQKKTGNLERNDVEMHVVFQKESEAWTATQALRASGLLVEPPWVSGKSNVEVTIR